MSAGAVRAAFKVRLQALLPVGWTFKETFGVNARPQANERWAALAFPGGSEDMTSIGAPGANSYIERGVAIVRFFAEMGTDAAAAMPAAADAVRDGFRNWRHATLDLKVGAVDPPNDFTDPEAAHAELQLGIPYRYRVLR